MFDRRSFLGAGGARRCSRWRSRRAWPSPRPATDKRFVFIIQRGAADGLGTIGAGRRSGLCRRARRSRRGLRRRARSSMRCSRCIRRWRNAAGLYGAGTGAVRARRRLALSRPLAFRRAERARDRRRRGAYQVKDGWLNRLLGVLPPDEAQGDRGRRRRCRWRCAAAARSRPTRPRRCPRRRTTCCSACRRCIRATRSSTRCGARRWRRAR